MKIYWANSLFTEAQRDFNIKWATHLRRAGHVVLLPQELASNERGYTPTATEIFLGDTSTLLTCDALVAVIDDETIDSGVATEIGIAYAHGIPVVPVYTDIRQYRSTGAMYKNLYPMGALSHTSRLASTVDELLENLSKHRAGSVATMVSGHPQDYRSHLAVLEDAYRPAWGIVDELERFCPNWREATIIDFGCGAGVTLDRLRARHFEGHYVGYDIDEGALVYARRTHPNVQFFAALHELLGSVEVVAEPVIVMANFVLHDMQDRQPFGQLVAAVPPGSDVFLCDLEVGDLPTLTRLVEASTGRAYRPGLDRRLSASRVHGLAGLLGLCEVRVEGRLLKLELEPSVLMRHVELFGILNGSDLGVPPGAEPKSSFGVLERLVGQVHHDERHFIVMHGRRPA